MTAMSFHILKANTLLLLLKIECKEDDLSQLFSLWDASMDKLFSPCIFLPPSLGVLIHFINKSLYYQCFDSLHLPQIFLH